MPVGPVVAPKLVDVELDDPALLSVQLAKSAFGHRINHPRYEETIGADLALREISPNHWVAADPCCVSDED